MNELINIIEKIVKQKEIQKKENFEEISPESYTCKYCKRSFKREYTLSIHVCEPKRRWEQKSNLDVVLGMKAFLRYYEIQHGTAQLKNYNDFVESKFYNAFVRFGKHIIDINAVEPDRFIDFVITKQIKIDQWTHESTYIAYLEEYINHENPEMALERSVKTIVKWSDESDEGIENFFNKVTGNRLVNYIKNGRISPWILYNCEQGQRALEKMNDEQLGMLYNIIDPRLWNLKNKNYPGDAEYIKHVLHEAGID